MDAAAAALVDAIVRANGCAAEDIAAAIFTVTDDLAEGNPAAAARARGWGSVPLLVVREHTGASVMERCVRVLVLWNTDTPQERIRHAYLGRAAALRPDLAEQAP